MSFFVPILRRKVSNCCWLLGNWLLVIGELVIGELVISYSPPRINQNHYARITTHPLSDTLTFEINIIDARGIEPIGVLIDTIIYSR